MQKLVQKRCRILPNKTAVLIALELSVHKGSWVMVMRKKNLVTGTYRE